MWLTEVPGLRNAAGLSEDELDALEELLDVARAVDARNRLLVRYYEGDHQPDGIGIDTVPENVKPQECCGWAKKAVTAVSERSRMDGFVFAGEFDDPGLKAVARRSNLVSSYNRNVVNELVHGCMFATVNDTEGGAVVRFHTAQTAAATWDSVHERVASGIVVARTARPKWSSKPVAMRMHMHLPGKVVVLERTAPSTWEARSLETPMGRPMMEAFRYRGSGIKPFGETRITRTVRCIVDDMTRLLQNLEVASCLHTTPMRALLGLSEEQYERVSTSKWSTYIGSVFASTNNDDGEAPTLQQLPQVSFQEFINKAQFHAKMFSAETGVPLSSLAVVQDNPSSAQAIQAQREDICIAASDLNESNGESMRQVALMAMAVEAGVSPDELDERQQSVMAHFIDPSRPSVVSQADAMVKVAAADPSFAGTSVFYEGVGFDQSDIERIRGEESRNQARQALAQALTGGTSDATAAQPSGQPERPAEQAGGGDAEGRQG